jgi:serine/threonine protein kinase
MSFSLNITQYEKVKIICESVHSLYTIWRHKVTNESFFVLISRSPFHNRPGLSQSMEWVSQLRHLSIARFLGYVAPRNVPSRQFHFFYKAFSRGSVHNLIYPDPRYPFELSNTQRLIILYGLIAAIATVHGRGLFFGNLTPHIVLLDENYEPHTVNCGFIEIDPTARLNSHPTSLYDSPEENKDS